MNKNIFLLLISISLCLAQSCYSSSEHKINGRCFRLVNQKLSYNDARDWCNYRNPSTYSYLATVADATTSNFLASYARTEFSTNEGSFWIGLSRPSSSSQYQWNDGTRLMWTNFQVQSGQNYVAESLANGKWITYSEDTKLNFVCSYDPNGVTGTPETASSTFPTTEYPTTGTTGDSCNRNSTSTILYAYSNDVEASVVASVLRNLVFLNQPPGNGFYQNFANVRFDVKQPESIQYHSDANSFNGSVSARLPDSSLGFSDNSIGSDIFNMIQRFVDNKRALCGSLLYILVQRYPNDVDISDLVEQLRRNHIFVYIVANENPSAGNNPHALFDVSDRTNGFCIFTGGEDFLDAGNAGSAVTYYPYQFVAQDFVVSGSGRKELPLFQTPIPAFLNSWALLAITVQNHKRDSHYLSLNYTIAPGVNGGDIHKGPDTNYPHAGTEMFDEMPLFAKETYKMTLDYSYATNDPQIITVRMSSRYYYPWLPFAN